MNIRPIYSILLLSLLIFSTTSLSAQSVSEFTISADDFFQLYVEDGAVDYEAIKQDPSSLHELMDQAQLVKVELSDPKAYQSFWINAYNIAVIKGIVDHYPLGSPLDVEGFFDQKKYELGGSSITLNDIENKKLRANFNEPRIHFALVCGAQGCPPIISKAYTPANLENTLEKQTRRSLNDPNFIRVSDQEVLISEIFKWYKEDFKPIGMPVEFINRYRERPISKDLSVGFYQYNWKLNKK